MHHKSKIVNLHVFPFDFISGGNKLLVSFLTESSDFQLFQNRLIAYKILPKSSRLQFVRLVFVF